MIKDSLEYRLISAHYGERVAKRSQVPLINHINEGLVVLDAINATDEAKRAFCLHPLLQADNDLKLHGLLVASSCDAKIVLLAMEYRSVANEFLSNRMDDEGIEYVMKYGGRKLLRKDLVRLSPLFEVNDMLIADKVQNYKDFVTYHKATHARSEKLDNYFNIWLTTLGVDDIMYTNLCRIIDESKTN